MNLPIILTLYAGFSHAFETDHILAVSSMVTTRNQLSKAVKDGMYWGLGHTSTILLVGIIFLLLKFEIAPTTFRYFEAAVGAMLILLGLHRMHQWYTSDKHIPYPHTTRTASRRRPYFYWSAYVIGLVHGLAGSGSLILIVLNDSSTVTSGLAYLLLFGLGSVAGMMLAAGAFSLPFTKKILNSNALQLVLIFASAFLCIVYGTIVLLENLA